MKQHPMTKAYIKAFCKAGGKAWKNKFNPYQLDQTIIFGYRKFLFRIYSAQTVPSWDSEYIPKGVTSNCDVVMIQSPDFGDWLACDAEAKAEFEEFCKLVKVVFAKK